RGAPVHRVGTDHVAGVRVLRGHSAAQLARPRQDDIVRAIGVRDVPIPNTRIRHCAALASGTPPTTRRWAKTRRMFSRVLRPADQPWGDYGDLLAYGMTAHLRRNDDGQLRLERTGPFVPAAFLSGVSDLLVTHEMRATLEASGLRVDGFRP